MLADLLRKPGTVLLDGPRPDADTGRRGARLFAAPQAILRADTLDAVGPILDAIDAAVADGLWVAGFMSYEAGYAFEPSRFPNPPDGDGPLAWFGVYDTVRDLDVGEVDAGLSEVSATVETPDIGMARADYLDAVGRIKRHIQEGDVYQVNLTMPLRFDVGDALALWAEMRRRQRVAYGAWVETGDRSVASVSPELFFRIDPADGGRTITARPMKGTARRGATVADDDVLADALVASEKDRAENLMIVDLLRNDLARVSRPGSVEVPALFEPERYQTVTQMTSTVKADLKAEASVGDVLRALFPCGSVTGAPKIRAMEVIRELERGPRGVYCGAIGSAGPDGAAFSVPIRTAVVADGHARYDVGSGIVWDSDPAAEYDECLLKARVLTDLSSPTGRGA